MMLPQTIHEYIKSQETAYETQKIQVGDNMHWNMREHIQLIFHLKNGYFFAGSNSDFLREFRQIMEPVLELNYWTEDLEVKDVTFFIEGRDNRVLSFLIKKYHDEVYSKKHNLDELFDEITESDLDYGGVVNQKGVERPETWVLNSIAFCDQTDILGGPIGVKLNFSPDKLRSMSKHGWGEESNGANISLEDICFLADDVKTPVGGMNVNKIPSKSIEVYIVRGNLPEHYLKDNDNMEDYYNQIQIVALYNVQGKQQQAILYRKKEEEGNLKFFTSKSVYSRALGRGIGERLVGPQIWSNWMEIHKNNLLEAASKVPLVTDDPTYTQKNKIQDMENLEVTTIEEGRSIKRIETASPVNIQLYEKSINELYELARDSGQAYNSLEGKEESAGMTFRGQERLVAQGRGPHERRKGKRAKYIEEIYRDWIIPDMKKEILKGKKFLATLSVDEMNWVSEKIASNLSNKRIKEIILSGKVVTQKEQQLLKDVLRQSFIKNGNKHLLEILKDEMADVEDKIGINIAGKQKNLVNLSDKLLSIIEVAMTNPQFRQNLETNGMTGTFNDLLEYSGLSPVDFASFASQLEMNTKPVISPMQPQQETSQLALNNQNGG